MTSPDLLAAILADPNDDLPRLVYADWLEENGEPERAEFIRSQIATNASGNCICGARGPSHVCFTCKMFDVKNVSGTSAMVITRRGFPDEIRCTLADWVGGACKNCASYNTEMVDLFGSLHHIAPLKKCPICHGTGRLSGIAGRVCGQWPVTRVVLVDREPNEWENGGFWYQDYGTHPIFNLRNPSTLPAELYDPKTMDYKVGHFRSKADAMAALSAAAIRYGRRLAGLDTPVMSAGGQPS